MVAQMVKSLPAMWETWVRSLGWEDPLEKEMATCSSILAWKILRTEEPGGLQSMGLQSETWLSNWHKQNKQKYKNLLDPHSDLFTVYIQFQWIYLFPFPKHNELK